MFSEVRKRTKKAGQPPGTLVYTGEKTGTPVITVLTYTETEVHEKTSSKLQDCLQPDNITATTWVNIEGLQDISLIEEIAKRFNLHPLTVEDILNVEQRPKVEEFDGYIFITLKALALNPKTNNFNTHQISLVLGKNYVLTFHELDTTRFDDIRKRMQATSNQRLRHQGSDYLAYRLIDVIVDEYFIVLEMLGDKIEKIEQRIISDPNPQNAKTIYELKRQMLLLRKSIWPMREAISHLLHVEDGLITKFTRIYLRDVYDHAMQAIDTLENFRDMLASLLDMYLSGLTIRMNEIMKILTIITTIFIPITAIASIYGMNIIDIPLMQSPWGFDIVITLMVMVAIGMIAYFKRKKWF